MSPSLLPQQGQLRQNCRNPIWRSFRAKARTLRSNSATKLLPVIQRKAQIITKIPCGPTGPPGIFFILVLFFLRAWGRVLTWSFSAPGRIAAQSLRLLLAGRVRCAPLFGHRRAAHWRPACGPFAFQKLPHCSLLTATRECLRGRPL